MVVRLDGEGEGERERERERERGREREIEGGGGRERLSVAVLKYYFLTGSREIHDDNFPQNNCTKLY